MQSNVQYPPTKKDDFMAKRSDNSSSDEPGLSPDQRRTLLQKEVEKERKTELEELKEWKRRMDIKRSENKVTRGPDIL